MEWYIWVWGAASTLALLCCIAALVVVIWYHVNIKANQDDEIREVNAINRSLEKDIKKKVEFIEQLRRELAEQRKEQNVYGRIIP